MSTIQNFTESTLSGVTNRASDPFSSMEINDQVNGTNGNILDSGLSSNSGTTRRIQRRMLTDAGIVNARLDYQPSLAFGRAGL